jgi:hypothetical protein
LVRILLVSIYSVFQKSLWVSHPQTLRTLRL